MLNLTLSTASRTPSESGFKALQNNFLETFWAFGLKLAQLKVANSIDQLEHSSRKHWPYVKNFIEGATKGPHIDLDVVDARFG